MPGEVESVARRPIRSEEDGRERGVSLPAATSENGISHMIARLGGVHPAEPRSVRERRRSDDADSLREG